MKRSLLALLVLSSLLQASDTGDRVQYVGGTIPGVANKSSARIDISQDDVLRLTAGKTILIIPYRDVNTVEYGMRVSRRYVSAGEKTDALSHHRLHRR
jgi:hypothetical protein